VNVIAEEVRGLRLQHAPRLPRAGWIAVQFLKGLRTHAPGRKTGAEPHLDATGRRHVILTRTSGSNLCAYSRQNVSRAARARPRRRAPISRSHRGTLCWLSTSTTRRGTRPTFSILAASPTFAFPRSRFGRDKAIYLLAYGVND